MSTPGRKPVPLSVNEEIVEVDEQTFKNGFNSLSRARRARLIGELSIRLADDLGQSYGYDDERWDLIATEGGADSTMWSSELENEYNNLSFSPIEELAFALYGLQGTANQARESLLKDKRNTVRKSVIK